MVTFYIIDICYVERKAILPNRDLYISFELILSDTWTVAF
jgi:hypothetical protein